ncbi:MAG: hypothetical protein Q9163_006210, partial [Psora crenata]
ACNASIIRFTAGLRVADSKDPTWDFVPPNLWGIAELTSGLLCSSLPIVPRFFRDCFPKLVSSLPSYSRSKSQPSSTKPLSTLHHRKASTLHYKGMDDPQLLTGSYVELEMDEQDSRRDGSTERRHVEDSHGMEQIGGADSKAIPWDVEHGAANHGVPQAGIRRTTRVDTSDQGLG